MDNQSATNSPTDNPKKRTNRGINRFSYEKNMTPYSLKYVTATALIKSGKTNTYIKAYTGLCNTTILRLRRGEIKLANEVVQGIKEHEAAKLAYLGNHILDSITPTDIEKASLLQKVTSSSILIDKRRLIEGQSTSNVNILAQLDSMANINNANQSTLDKLNEMEVVDSQPLTSANNDTTSS